MRFGLAAEDGLFKHPACDVGGLTNLKQKAGPPPSLPFPFAAALTASRAVTSAPRLQLHLACTSPAPRLHLACISPAPRACTSRLHLAGIAGGRALRLRWRAHLVGPGGRRGRGGGRGGGLTVEGADAARARGLAGGGRGRLPRHRRERCAGPRHAAAGPRSAAAPSRRTAAPRRRRAAAARPSCASFSPFAATPFPLTRSHGSRGAPLPPGPARAPRRRHAHRRQGRHRQVPRARLRGQHARRRLGRCARPAPPFCPPSPVAAARPAAPQPSRATNCCRRLGALTPPCLAPPTTPLIPVLPRTGPSPAPAPAPAIARNYPHPNQAAASSVA